MTGRRKNGAGTIRKRKDGRWEGRVVVSYKENGDPVTKNVLAKTRTECQNKLNELIEKTLPPAKNWLRICHLACGLTFGIRIIPNQVFGSRPEMHMRITSTTILSRNLGKYH